MNHPRLKMNRKEGIAFGDTTSRSSPPSRSQICGQAKRQSFAESGFGGWADEKIKTAREAAPLLSRKKSHPQHLTISLGNHDFRCNDYWVSEYKKPQWVNDTNQPGTYFYVDIRNLRCVMLDTNFNPSGQSCNVQYEYSYLSAEELDWLEQTLQSSDEAGKFSVLFSHHPMGACETYHDARNAEALREVIARHKVIAVFSGHYHKERHSIALGSNLLGRPIEYWVLDASVNGDFEASRAAHYIVSIDDQSGVLVNLSRYYTYTIVEDQRTLSISSTAGGSVSVPGEGWFEYDYGSEVSITATADLNYHFIGWTGSAVDAGKIADPGSASTTATMDADYTLQANFEIDQRTLSVSSTAGGSVSTPGEGEGAHQYDHGSVVAIVAAAEANYHFVGWTGSAIDACKVADPGLASTTVTVDADYSLKANFAIDQRTLIISSTAGGSVSVPGEGSFDYDHGAAVLIEATAEANYHFVRWSGIAVDAGKVAEPELASTAVTIDADYTLQANFAIDTFTLDYAAGAGGSLTGETSQVVDYGTSGTVVTAVPDLGYHFVDWSNSSIDNPRTDTGVTANVNVTANFAIDQMTIFGYITEPDANIPVEGVFIDANNDGSSDTTAANGYYQLTVDYGWSGTVEPNKTAYTFEPPRMEYDNITTDQNDNYTAILDTFIISGYAVDSEMLTPLEGALVEL